MGMGTAPAIWNDVMGLMVDVVPREWFAEGWLQPATDKYPTLYLALSPRISPHPPKVNILQPSSPSDFLLVGDRWRRKGWSQGLASFSKPLVDFTDLFVGEYVSLGTPTRGSRRGSPPPRARRA